MNSTQIRPSELLATPSGLLALGFGSGLLPRMPGTWGTLFAVPFVFLLLHLSPGLQFAILIALMLVGVFICDRVSKKLGGGDHKAIVWDEMVGYGCAVFALEPSLLWMTLAFVFFRLLDIAKPWPLSVIDRWRGGHAIMGDDVVAGFFVCGCLHGVDSLVSLFL